MSIRVGGNNSFNLTRVSKQAANANAVNTLNITNIAVLRRSVSLKLAKNL